MKINLPFNLFRFRYTKCHLKNINDQVKDAASLFASSLQGLSIQELQQETIKLHRDVATSMQQIGVTLEGLPKAEIVKDLLLFEEPAGSENYLGDPTLLGIYDDKRCRTKVLFLYRLSSQFTSHETRFFHFFDCDVVQNTCTVQLFPLGENVQYL